jgi:uncharacterized membrane protein YhaH (DUF805 family)
MNYRDLFTSYLGRISRKPFWIGNLIMIAITLAIVVPLAVIKELKGIDLGRRGDASVQLAMFLILLYPWAAVLVKRLHDRDRPGILAAVYLVPAFLSDMAAVLGLTGDPDKWNLLDYSLSGIVLVVALWFLIEFGFVRGTPGPNRYGPDPLARKT